MLILMCLKCWALNLYGYRACSVRMNRGIGMELYWNMSNMIEFEWNCEKMELRSNLFFLHFSFFLFHWIDFSQLLLKKKGIPLNSMRGGMEGDGTGEESFHWSNFMFSLFYSYKHNENNENKFLYTSIPFGTERAHIEFTLDRKDLRLFKKFQIYVAQMYRRIDINTYIHIYLQF